MASRKVLIFGAGGHAKVVMDAVEKAGIYEIAFLVDDDPLLKGEEVFGYRVIGDRLILLSDRRRLLVEDAIVAVGKNSARVEVARWLKANGFQLVSAIHPTACLGRGVRIEENTVVMAGVVINSDSKIGSSAIINTAATVDHDCVIGAGVHVAPGCHLCGNVSIGSGTLIGAGTTIVPGVSIGDNSVIGAGSLITDSLPAKVVATGRPAKVVALNNP